MSLFSYSYGRLMSFDAVLNDTSARTLLSVTESDDEITALRFQAALPSGASDTTVRFDVYDGSTAYPVGTWILTQANGVCSDATPIHLSMGWSLRATRSAGSNVAVTGSYVRQNRV